MHREAWKQAPLELEIFRPLSMLYHCAAIEGLTLTADFDRELMNMLVARWGDPDSIQYEIKESYWAAYHKQGALTGNIPEHDKERVLAGIINLYRQSGGKTILPEPSCQWRV